MGYKACIDQQVHVNRHLKSHKIHVTYQKTQHTALTNGVNSIPRLHLTFRRSVVGTEQIQEEVGGIEGLGTVVVQGAEISHSVAGLAWRSEGGRNNIDRIIWVD